MTPTSDPSRKPPATHASRSHAPGRAGPRSPARISRLLGLVVLVLIVVGCAAAATQPARAPGGDQGFGGDGSNPGSGGGAPFVSPAPTAGSNAEAALRIAWTGRLQLQVANLDTALAEGQAAIKGIGGFTSASRRSGGDRPVASVTYRIPSDRWDDGLAALRRVAVKVLDEETNSADLASQIVDIEARLRNLRASETALQAIASQATRISDVLEVQARLTETRGQIESLAAQQAALGDRVAYGTLNVTLGTEVVAVTEAAKQWDPARDVDAASASLLAVAQGLVSALIWLGIVWLPMLLVGIVLLLALRFAWRWLAPRLPLLQRQEPAYAYGTGWAGQGAPVPPPPPAPASGPPPADSSAGEAGGRAAPAPEAAPGHGVEMDARERDDRIGG